ncbi:hypothetical protein ACFV6F_21050 [Kitasatospora phosalacinea]|uniref:hypothetical protein n=1 Tax=Kitasatospora phosalacinea TaxID=2065 RepID=UPI00365CA574
MDESGRATKDPAAGQPVPGGGAAAGEAGPPPPDRSRRRRPGRRATALGLLASAVLLVALAYAAARAARDGGPVVLIVLFHHPLPYGAAVLVLVVLAVLTGFRSRTTRTLLLVPLLGCALLASPVALFVFGDMPHQSADRPAPGRSDRRLVVHEGAAVIDPLWWVSVDTGSGLTARRWPVGSFNGDDPDNALASARWDGPDRIELATEGGEVFVVALDPETGRPERQVRAG